MKPSTRELILAMWANTGGYHRPRWMALRLGRPAAEIRTELLAMEREGLAERWHERPGMEWRFGPKTSDADTREG